MGVKVSSSAIRDASDLKSAIDSISREQNTGLIITPGAPISDLRKMLFELTNQKHLPQSTRIHTTRWRVASCLMGRTLSICGNAPPPT
jgi:hypothetical protein